MKAFTALMIAILFLLLGAAMQGVHLRVLFNIPALVMVGGPLLAYQLYSQGYTGSIGLARRLFTNAATDDDINSIRGLIAFGFILGGIGTVVSVVIAMGLLDQGTAVIGHAIGSAFSAALFGAMPSMLLLPLSKRPLKNLSLVKMAAAYCGFIVMSSFGIFSFAMWIVSGSPA